LISRNVLFEEQLLIQFRTCFIKSNFKLDAKLKAGLNAANKQNAHCTAYMKTTEMQL